MLTKHYGKAPIIIIDEYDTPIQEGYSKDFYDEIIGFMRNFFSGAFKDNKNLTYGFLTGILRIAQESIFSGLNNLTVNSVMDEKYDQFFGFTASEVRDMLEYYGALDKEAELKDWYDGYLFGSTEIYNPWSVINYISKGCIPQAYWVNTGKMKFWKMSLRWQRMILLKDFILCYKAKELLPKLIRMLFIDLFQRIRQIFTVYC